MECFYNRLILRNKFYCKIWETFILLRDRQIIIVTFILVINLIKGDNLKWNFIE